MPRSLVLALVLALATVTCAEQPSPDPGQGGPAPVIAAVGDIACNSLPSDHSRRCRYDAVAETIRGIGPDAFLALGDLQYLHGGLEDFQRYYDRYFGDLKEITAPVPGNHETYTLYAEGYYDYFGKDANGPGGFYSFDLGTWHLVALNSQICKGSTWNPDLGQQTPITKNEVIGEGCGPGTPMYEWAKRDLALHPADCTIAFFHHPLHGAEPWPAGVFLYQLQPLWQLLDDNGVDVVLNGHEHSYQRYGPQDAYGRPDPNGIVQFTVGTGGSTYGSLPEGELAANMVAGQDTSFGVLKMTLLEGGYDFEFVTAQGEAPFSDSGQGDCV